MRPNVRISGSFAGGPEEPSAVNAFSSARTAGVDAMGRMIGEGVTMAAQAKVQGILNRERAFTKAQVAQFLPRGASFGSAAPTYQPKNNQGAFEAIGGALRDIVGFNKPAVSQGSSLSPQAYWKPSGNDGWGDTQLGARGSNESMVSKAIAGFSFL